MSAATEPSAELVEAILDLARRTDEAPTLAGYQRHVIADPGVLVVLVNGHEQGISSPRDSDGKWALVCDPHGSILTDTNKRRLAGHMTDPASWCEDCREAMEKRQAPPAIVYADLRQYPPERTHGEGSCGECTKSPRWVVLAHEPVSGATVAVRVCAEHLGKIWNAQGRPA